MVHDTRGTLVKKQQPNWFQGIRGRFTLSFCLLFILILTGFLIASIYGIPGTDFNGRKGHQLAEAIHNLDLIAEAKKDRLLFWLNERSSAVNFLSANDLVEKNAVDIRERFPQAVSAAPDSELWREVQVQQSYAALIKFFVKIQNAYKFYESIQILDAATGRVMVSTNREHLGRDFSSSKVYIGTLKAGGGHVSDLESFHAGRTPSFFFSDLIRDRDGKVIAILALEVNAEEALRPVLNAGEGLGKRGEVLLVNQRAQILTSLKYPPAAGGLAKALEYRVETEPAARAARGENGHVEARDYRGVSVLAAYRYLPITPEWGWGMVVKIDSEFIFAPFRRDLTEAFWLALCGMLIVVFFTTVLARNVTRPILQLGQSAEDFAAGDFSVRSGLKRSDEIGSLSAVFDVMADTVEKTMVELEDQAAKLQETAAALEARQESQTNALTISAALAASVTLDELLERGLNELMLVTRSQVGAIYLADKQAPGRFSLAKQSGVAPETSLQKEILLGQGSLGLTAQRRVVEVLQDIPQQTRFSVATIAGEKMPNSIVNVPLVLHDEVVGIVALASLYPIGPGPMEAIEMTRRQLATAISNALTHAETERQAIDLQTKNEELQVQSEELQAQSEEMRAQTEELIAQQKQVEEADRLKSEFLSNMSHELRTPLNSIMALSQLMISRGPGKNPEEEAEYLVVIERNGRNLLNLINDILDISKIEAGQIEIHPSDIDINRLLDWTLETVRPLLDEKGLELNIRSFKALKLCSDQDKVQQILLNLLSNAIKFTAQGEIEVSVSKGGNWGVAFAVRDTGIGITERDMAHIFDEFRQVDGSTTRLHEGTGLGLTICRKLARALGGDIMVTSEEGKGSTFTLALPSHFTPRPTALESVIEDAPPVADLPAAAAASPAPADAVHPQVLVVEDNPVASLQIRSALEEHGYRVQSASGGEEGLACVRAQAPDGIVLDLMMPGIDGFEVLEHIRSTPETATLPVLILTAKELTAEDRARLSHNNISQLIQKGSVDREQLVAAVDRLTRRHIEPEAIPEKIPPARAGQAAIRRKDTGQRPILIVEDNPDNRLTLQALLDELDYRHIAAEDGAQAVRVAREESPALILMDIHLPVLSGLDATRQIKSDPAFREIPIIALTARAMKGDRENFLVAGCDDYLAKPIAPEALTKILDKWMGG